jgi:hypothetical protein
MRFVITITPVATISLTYVEATGLELQRLVAVSSTSSKLFIANSFVVYCIWAVRFICLPQLNVTDLGRYTEWQLPSRYFKGKVYPAGTLHYHIQLGRSIHDINLL